MSQKIELYWFLSPQMPEVHDRRKLVPPRGTTLAMNWRMWEEKCENILRVLLRNAVFFGGYKFFTGTKHFRSGLRGPLEIK